MEETQITNGNDVPKRPTLLSVLCILTFVFSGIGGLWDLITLLFSDKIIELLKSTPNYDDATMGSAIILLQAGWLYYLISFVLTACAIFGAILMWRLKKLGFHFYALSNLVLLFVPLLILGITISWEGILFTSIFIALYAFNFKYLK
jgi:hypothetical protein